MGAEFFTIARVELATIVKRARRFSSLSGIDQLEAECQTQRDKCCVPEVECLALFEFLLSVAWQIFGECMLGTQVLLAYE